MSWNVLPLPELALNTPATITSMTGSDYITQRLLELGLLEGDTVEIIGVAPLGDPLEIQSRHGIISLRRNEAARIHVEPATRSA
ncbi:MAG: ferrous iron transport protein A [Planctomycetia bacterium]|nr:ferrous iron transport protein A [Planctomycetia bacterium]